MKRFIAAFIIGALVPLSLVANANHATWNWEGASPPVHVDTSMGGELGTTADTQIHASLNVWNAISGSIFDFIHCCSLDYNIPGIWNLGNVSDGNIDITDAGLATGICGGNSNGVNGNQLRKSIVYMSYNTNWYNSSGTTPGPTEMDLRTCALHEAGHTTHIGHVSQLTCGFNTQTPMSEGMATGTTSCRDLTATEVNLMLGMY